MAPRRLVPFLVLLLCALTAAFATPTAPAWTHQAWQLSEGLPNTFVIGTARTADGYLWVGTRTQLARFDGLRFEPIPTSSFWSGPPQGLRLLVPALDGGLWVGLDNGLIVHLKDGAVKTFPKDPPKLVPLNLVEGPEGVLWVVYRKGILCRIAGETAEVIGPEQGLPAGTTCSVVRDAAGQIWCARGRFLTRLQGKRFEPVCALDAKEAILGPGRVEGLWVYSNRRVLRFTPGAGLVEKTTLPAAHSGITPTLLAEDRTGAIWLGTFESGLLRFDKTGRVDSIATSDRQIENLAEEADGSLWIGTAGGGLNRIRTQAIDHETTPLARRPSPMETSVTPTRAAPNRTRSSAPAKSAWSGGIMTTTAPRRAGAGRRMSSSALRQAGSPFTKSSMATPGLTSWSRPKAPPAAA